MTGVGGLSPLVRRDLSGHSHPGRRRSADRNLRRRGQASIDVRDDRDAAAVRRPAVVMKRELADLPGWGWVARTYRRHSGRPPRRRCRAETHAEGGREAVSEGRPIVVFPGRHACPSGRAAAAPAGLRRPVPRSAFPSCRSRSTAAGFGRGGASPSGREIVTMRFGEAIPPGRPRRRWKRKCTARSIVLDSAEGPAG